ncbi:hypothetical protein RJI07_01850 [Mycoplasmatota bacterium WC30]
MEIFMKILGTLISLAMILFGLRFVIKPRSAIQSLQRLKYKQTGEPRKNEIILSIVFGSIFSLIGVYYLIIVILSIIYPA